MDDDTIREDIIDRIRNYDGDEPLVAVAPDGDGMIVAHNNLSQQDMNTVIQALLRSQSKGAALICLKNLLESEFADIDAQDIRETVDWLTNEIGQHLSNLSLHSYFSSSRN